MAALARALALTARAPQHLECHPPRLGAGLCDRVTVRVRVRARVRVRVRVRVTVTVRVRVSRDDRPRVAPLGGKPPPRGFGRPER